MLCYDFHLKINCKIILGYFCDLVTQNFLLLLHKNALFLDKAVTDVHQQMCYPDGTCIDAKTKYWKIG